MAPVIKRLYTETGFYQSWYASDDEEEDDDDVRKTFRSIAPVLASHPSTSIYRGKKRTMDSSSALRNTEDSSDDQLRYESTDCSPERKKQISKLDETGDGAFSCLKSVENDWERKPEVRQNNIKDRSIDSTRILPTS